MLKRTQGQILAEMLIAISVGAILVTFGAQLFNVSLRAIKASKERGQAARLAQEGLEALRAIASSPDASSQAWNKIYRPPDGGGDPSLSKGSANPYYPAISTSTPASWLLLAGSETLTLNGETYTRRIIIDNVSRSVSSEVETIYNSANDDPATQLITVIVSKPNAPDTALTEYLTRFLNLSSLQTDWSGPADCGPVGATSSPTGACLADCLNVTSTVGSFRLPNSC